jgi:DNA-binding winged helix-turn-helix (wHTH) protein
LKGKEDLSRYLCGSRKGPELAGQVPVQGGVYMSGTASVIGHVPHIMTQPQPRRVRFEDFEIDLVERKLYRKGELVELQSKGFAFLAALIRRPGETVSRYDLASELWPGVYVQVDQGLNAAVRKVRRALGDDAYAPRFIQTIGSLGYRFIGHIKADDLERRENLYS